MQLVDTVTPSLNEYQKQLVNYEGSGGETRRQRANDWAAMYYQNAYNMQMQNFMNEYNSPLQQMLRYQEAGLNPFLAQNDPGNMSSPVGGASPSGSRDPGATAIQIAQTGIQGMNSVNNVLKTAQQMYDYIQYGRPLNEVQLNIQNWDANRAKFEADSAQYLALQREAESAWARYWNLGEEGYVDSENGSKLMSESPRARYMDMSTQRIAAQISQLQSLVDVLYPSQEEANKANAALNDYKKQVLEGQKGAILQLDTGDPTRDAVLKQVLFWLGDKLHY